MNKITTPSRVTFVSIGSFLAFLFVFSATVQSAQAALTTQLQLGSKGVQVSELQQFLATNPQIYPAGIISGYYGPLTQAAVVQFQVAYDIAQAGRVGPATMAQINSIMASGLGLDIDAPVMGNVAVQTNRTGATVNWITFELARSQVFYDTQPLRLDEATLMHAEQPYVSGLLAPSDTVAHNLQSVSITGLQPNTVYYYLTRGIDNSGNVSMTLPSSFVTNQ